MSADARGEGIGAVPDMARRSVIGGFGWGVVIAAMVSLCRHAYAWWLNPVR